MTASTVSNRPTVESTSAAHAAFSWAFRGEPDRSLNHLRLMDDVALHALRLGAAVLLAQADQILGGTR